MKVSKVFGFVLSLHLVVVAVLIVQPGCGTMQPPTQVYQQDEYIGPMTSKSSDTLSSTGRTDMSLDPAFNTGLDTIGNGRYTPGRPDEEFTEFDEITPKLTPITSESAGPEVTFTGTSYETHIVQKGDNLWAISKRYNCSLDELYAANGLNKNSVLSIGQEIQVPVEGGTGTVKTVTADAYQPSGFKMTTRTYLVKAGDTLSGIARNHDTTVSVIKAANNKTSDIIRVGEKLLIPVNGTATSRVSVAPKPNVSASAPALPADNSSGIHIVKAGEYPATIARQYGMTTTELLTINNIADPRKMQVGQKLKVGSGSGATKVSSAPKVTVTPVPSVAKTVEVNEPKVITEVSKKDTPVEIRVIEADPLIESEDIEIEPDTIFEDAVEIPVILMEE